MPARPDPRQSERTKKEAAALDEVRSVYAALEERPVERACIHRAECCHFKRTGLTPMLTKGEALVLARAVRASGRRRITLRADGSCPLLNAAGTTCTVYAGRPFGCRTHYCAAAGGDHARRDVVDLIHRLEAVDRQLGGNGASALPKALQRCLEELE